MYIFHKDSQIYHLLFLIHVFFYCIKTEFITTDYCTCPAVSAVFLSPCDSNTVYSGTYFPSMLSFMQSVKVIPAEFLILSALLPIPESSSFKKLSYSSSGSLRHTSRFNFIIERNTVFRNKFSFIKTFDKPTYCLIFPLQPEKLLLSIIP